MREKKWSNDNEFEVLTRETVLSDCFNAIFNATKCLIVWTPESVIQDIGNSCTIGLQCTFSHVNPVCVRIMDLPYRHDDCQILKPASVHMKICHTGMRFYFLIQDSM